MGFEVILGLLKLLDCSFITHAERRDLDVFLLSLL